MRNPFASPLWRNRAFVRVWAAGDDLDLRLAHHPDRAAARRRSSSSAPGASRSRSCAASSSVATLVVRAGRRRLGRPAAAAAGPDLGRSRPGGPARLDPGRVRARRPDASRSSCVVSGPGGDPDHVLRRRRQRLPADRSSSASGWSTPTAPWPPAARPPSSSAFGISGFLVQLLTRADRDRHRRGHVPRLGACSSASIRRRGGRRRRRPRTASRSSTRSATACGSSATTRSCGRSPARRWRSPRCGASSGRPGSCSSLDELGLEPGGPRRRRRGRRRVVVHRRGRRRPARRGAGASGRWRSARCSWRPLGNAFIPLAPAGAAARRDRAAWSLQQLVADSAVTVYDITEVVGPPDARRATGRSAGSPRRSASRRCSPSSSRRSAPGSWPRSIGLRATSWLAPLGGLVGGRDPVVRRRSARCASCRSRTTAAGRREVAVDAERDQPVGA